MVKKTVGVKLSQEWIAEIDAYAQSKGIARSKAIEEAIAQYFNLQPKQPEQPKPERPNLEELVYRLSEHLVRLSDRVLALEKATEPAKNVIKFPTGRSVTSKQSPVKQPTTNNQQSNPKLDAIARRAEQCGMSVEEALEFAPWLIG